uniref:Uncharacterized protein n=1 Tax=Panagrolaimus davidi TaxID=227884 RepID=A0A914PIV2_9BILA
MYENFGSRVFWGLNLSVNFNNIEPLIFIGNRETLFGFAEGDGGISCQEKNQDEKEGLLFTPCSCQCLQFRHWICKNCWNLIKVLEDGNIWCDCGVQKVGTLQKECFQCILNSKSNVSNRHRRRSSSQKEFKEARDQLSNFFKLQDPPKKRPKKVKKVEIIPPDPHISSPKSSAPPRGAPPPPSQHLPSTHPPLHPPPPAPIHPQLNDELSIALEQLHENVKVATELCEDVLQKVAKKEISEIPKPEPPKAVTVEEPITESLEVLKQKVEEALEYVEEIKVHEESKTNSEA